MAERVAWSLLWSGVFLMVSAVAAEWTGTKAPIGGHTVNTHVTATWVLGTLGLVLVGNAFALFGATNEKTGATEQDGS